MNSFRLTGFLKNFAKLPDEVKELANKTYLLWKENPHYNSFQFKQIHPTKPFYSVRVGSNWRAVGYMQNKDIYWFWIGSHEDYNKLIRQL